MPAPTFIPPCSPTRALKPPPGDDWLHEPKLDGYRLQVIKEGRQIRLYSRSGFEWTRRLPDLAQALAEIPCRTAVLDAELCRPGADGSPDFFGLHRSMHEGELAVFA